MRAILLGLFLVPISVDASNIFVVDSGLSAAYRSQLASSGRLLRESCYSSPGDLRRCALGRVFDAPVLKALYAQLG